MIFDLSFQDCFSISFDMRVMRNKSDRKNDFISESEKMGKICLQNQCLADFKAFSLGSEFTILGNCDRIKHPGREIIRKYKTDFSLSSARNNCCISESKIIKLFSQVFDASIASTTTFFSLSKEGPQGVVEIFPVSKVSNAASYSIVKIRKRSFDKIIEINEGFINNAKRNSCRYRFPFMIRR